MTLPQLSDEISLSVQPSFDYAALDPATADRLRGSAALIRQIAQQSIFDMGRELAEAQAELASYSDGTFVAWVEAETGLSTSTAYNLINAYKLKLSFPNVGKLNLTLTAAYQLAAPSTSPEVVEGVLARGEAGERVTRQTVEQVQQTVTQQHAERILACFGDPARPRHVADLRRESGLEDSAFHKALNFLLGDRKVRTSGAAMYQRLPDPPSPAANAARDAAISEPPLAEDALRAVFNPDAIKLIGRTDDGAHHRAIDVARHLVAAGLWNGADELRFDAYDLHYKLLGPFPIATTDLKPGDDYTLIFSNERLADAILAVLAGGPLTYAEMWRAVDAHLRYRVNAAQLATVGGKLLAAGQAIRIGIRYAVPSTPAPAANAARDTEISADSAPAPALLSERVWTSRDGTLIVRAQQMAVGRYPWVVGIDEMRHGQVMYAWASGGATMLEAFRDTRSKREVSAELGRMVNAEQLERVSEISVEPIPSPDAPEAAQAPEPAPRAPVRPSWLGPEQIRERTWTSRDGSLTVRLYEDGPHAWSAQIQLREDNIIRIWSRPGVDALSAFRAARAQYDRGPSAISDPSPAPAPEPVPDAPPPPQMATAANGAPAHSDDHDPALQFAYLLEKDLAERVLAANQAITRVLELRALRSLHVLPAESLQRLERELADLGRLADTQLRPYLARQGGRLAFMRAERQPYEDGDAGLVLSTVERLRQAVADLQAVNPASPRLQSLLPSVRRDLTHDLACAEAHLSQIRTAIRPLALADQPTERSL